MNAYVLSKTGRPDILKVTEAAEPDVQADEVKIRVECIGINYAEVLSRRGQYRWAPKKPYIPGMEATGEIVSIGENIRNHQVGDKVIVGSQFGAYAEYMCVPEHLAFPCPRGFTSEECASLLVNFMTGWVALKKLGKVQANEVVLIHAAAGGVGTAAIQLARSLGAKVIGTASRPEKLKLIKELGADRAINYLSEDFLEIIKAEYGGADMVLEVVGGEVYTKSLAALNPFGRLIVVGFASISLKKWNPYTWWTTWRDAPKVNVMDMAKGSYAVGATHIGYLTGMKNVAQSEWKLMLDHIEQNKLRPHVGRVFDFGEMAQAHEWIESRESMGKVVVKL